MGRCLAQPARVYGYDRAGYGRSEPSPNKQYSAKNRNIELGTMRGAARIEPRYVLVGHSYGGVLVRGFLHQCPEKVVGMVLVDSARSRTPLPPETFSLLGNLSYYEIVGLDQNHVVSEEEYEMIKTDEKRNIPTAHIEESYMEESTIAVNDAWPEGYSILGNKPLSVIFANETVDFTKIHHHAVETASVLSRRDRGWLYV